MLCKFCQIAAGTLDSDRVYQYETSLAFLDHRPLFPGHTLLIPREHYETLSELPDQLLAPLFATARLLARAVETGLGAEGSFVAINNKVSQSVPHLHIHVVPRRRKDGLKGFFWPRQVYRDAQQIAEVRQALETAIGTLTGRRPC